MTVQPVALHNGWKMTFSSATQYLDLDVLEQLQVLIPEWVKAFPKESTWVQQNLGVPTLVLRFDFVVHDGRPCVYEIEDRPRGIGFNYTYNEDFRRKIDYLRVAWPLFGWIQSPTRDNDDELWLGSSLSIEEARKGKEPLLVLARPDEPLYHELAHRAVAPVQTEGDKSYGLSMGLWQEVEWRVDPNDGVGYVDTLRGDAFVLKPRQGTRCHKIMMYVEPKKRPPTTRSSDFVSIDRMEREVQRQPGRKMFRQEFHPPMELPGAPGLNAIYRLYFGYNPRTSSYVALGGVWMATPGLPVHGTDKAITGLLGV